MPLLTRNRLSLKLILGLTAILIINLAFYTFFTVQNLKEDLINFRSASAYNISDIIKSSTRYSMLKNHREDLGNIISTIGEEKGVKSVRIFNKLGIISFSSDSLEIGKEVDMNAEACIMCHEDGKITSTPPADKLMRFYQKENGERVVGLINPVHNQPDCTTSECHTEDRDKKILGVLDVVLSVEESNRVFEANINNLVFNTILVAGALGLFSIIFIMFYVSRPISKISDGVAEIGKGNLQYRIDLQSKDELGGLAHEINSMAEKLDKAYTELQEWSETLNEKVKEKNIELKKIYEQIIRVEKLASLGKLSATVAHELNNPLEGILTYSKLITKKLSKANEDKRHDDLIKFTTLISDESARCGRIVKDLLVFSHDSVHDSQQNRISELIDKALLLINHHLQINNIVLEKEYSDTGIILKCDGQKIEQALVAMLINAVEAMSGEGVIKVKLEKAGTDVIIRLTDTGHGISDADMQNIFEPFYTTKEKGKGTGLGLSVAYGIINSHGGKIEVEETSVKGTTFKITLPIKE